MSLKAQEALQCRQSVDSASTAVSDELESESNSDVEVLKPSGIFKEIST